jgi:RpiR family carbohydrate utilization transcriptional regulator
MSGGLSVSERRVATTILEHPYEFLDWSVADLSRESGSSGATVVRTCRRLGFSGVRDLRLTLARDLGWPGSADQPAASRRQLPLIEELFQSASQSFLSMVPRTSADAFKQAVEKIASARQVLVVAAGPSSVFAQDFVYHARLGGLPAEFCPDVMMQAVAASRLNKSDVCIAVSASGLNSLTIEAAETASSQRAKIVAVTGYRHSRLAELASMKVIIDNLDYSTTSQSIVNSAGIMIMMRGLVMAAVNRSNEQSDRTTIYRENTAEIISKFSYRHPPFPQNGATT